MPTSLPPFSLPRCADFAPVVLSGASIVSLCIVAMADNTDTSRASPPAKSPPLDVKAPYHLHDGIPVKAAPPLLPEDIWGIPLLAPPQHIRRSSTANGKAGPPYKVPPQTLLDRNTSLAPAQGRTGSTSTVNEKAGPPYNSFLNRNISLAPTPPPKNVKSYAYAHGWLHQGQIPMVPNDGNTSLAPPQGRAGSTSKAAPPSIAAVKEVPMVSSTASVEASFQGIRAGGEQTPRAKPQAGALVHIRLPGGDLAPGDYMNENNKIYYIRNTREFMSYIERGLLEGIPVVEEWMGYYRLRWGERVLDDGPDVFLRELGIEDNAELTLELVLYGQAQSRGAP